MAPLHILHLTDLHLAPTPSWNQKVLLDGLLKDLETLRFTQSAPDFVVFSGDLANAASVQGAYDGAFEFLLSALNVLGLDESRLILCPGNHDADRNVVAPCVEDVKRWRLQARTADGANALLDDHDYLGYLDASFDCFRALSEQFSESSRVRLDRLSATYFMRDAGVSFVSLNTASLTGTGLTTDLDDRGNLCVPERTLIEALDAAPAGQPVIVIGHHPSSWMNDENAAIFERILAGRAVAYLSGHLHDSRPQKISALNGEYLHVQSGALYTGRSRWNGYALVSMDLEKQVARVMYRRWFEQRREFSKAEDLSNGGIFYTSEQSQSYWQAITSDIDPVAIDHWRETSLLPSLLSECNSSMSEQSLDSVFVSPEFEREVPYRTEGDGRVGSRVETLSFIQMVSSVDNYVISSEAQTGKSTALKQIALEIARRKVVGVDWSVPVILGFDGIKGYVAQIENLVRQKLPELPAGLTLKALLSRGALTLLVDDVDFSKAEKRDALVKFVTSYPKCRYVFTSSTAFVETSALRPEIAPAVPFSRVRMQRMKTSQLLTLIENHGLTDPLKADQMLTRVIRDASALNVPLTAVTGTFLIQILQDDPDHSLLNQAALIERYIEMSLQKYAPRELLPGTFDFKNKVDLLCTVAEHMVKTGEYDPEENTMLDWCLNYLKSYGLDFSATDLITYFLGARVLERSGNRIHFRLRMFF